MKTGRSKVAACARRGPDPTYASSRSSAAAMDSAVGSLKKTPVSPSPHRLEAPPPRHATTGRPEALASSGTSPKSSSPAKITPRQLGDGCHDRVRLSAEEPHGRARQCLEAGAVGAVTDHDQTASQLIAGANRQVDPLVGDEPRDDQVEVPLVAAVEAEAPQVDGGGMTTASRP